MEVTRNTDIKDSLPEVACVIQSMNTDQASQSAGCFKSNASKIMHVVVELMVQRAIQNLVNDVSPLL